MWINLALAAIALSALPLYVLWCRASDRIGSLHRVARITTPIYVAALVVCAVALLYALGSAQANSQDDCRTEATRGWWCDERNDFP